MSLSEEFEIKFHEENIKDFYIEKIMYKSSTGLDRINASSFSNNIKFYCSTISRKVKNNTYKFTPYKQRLIVKGRNKNPRVISIPTIRDKITLGLLKEILFDVFGENIDYDIPQTKISDIADKLNIHKYEHYVKIDLSNFYGSLNHDWLFKKLYEKIEIDEINTLIKKALRTPTIDEQEKHKNVDKVNRVGVPQGLSISNVLASIYIYDFDVKHKSLDNYAYFRYVDDILILCNDTESKEIYENLIKELQDESTYKLKINEEKTKFGKLSNGFTYLGYKIDLDGISVRENSVLRLERSFEKLFIEYKHAKTKNVDFFIWKINLRITGCISDRKKYGWLFFFSQITDKKLLFKLDWLISKLIKRFNMTKATEEKQIKTFVRTYHEIIKNLGETKYIPNFSNYSLEDKKYFLTNIGRIDIASYGEENISIEFDRIIFSSIKDLEKDIQNLS